MESSKTYAHVDAPEHVAPVDFVLLMLQSLLITTIAFPLGVAAALLHVLGTVVRNIPTCAMLVVTCVVLTSAVLIASVGYVIIWGGLLGLRAIVVCKRTIESSAALGSNMASMFIDEWMKETDKALDERWART